MAATATVLDAESGVTGGNATVRYFGADVALAEGDTIGITVEADTNLHTVPAGGQSLYKAAEALGILCAADGYPSAVALNDQYDVCLHIQGGTGTNVALTLPVFVVA